MTKRTYGAMTNCTYGAITSHFTQVESGGGEKVLTTTFPPKLNKRVMSLIEGSSVISYSSSAPKARYHV